MHDPTPRIIKVGDALSQFVNVLLLPNHKATTPNESISGRSYRNKWRLAVRIIDAILGKDHCEKAFMRDIERAHLLLLRYPVEHLPPKGRV